MSEVASFYTGAGGIVGAIETALGAAGIDRSSLRAADLAPVDEFHIRGRAATLEIGDALELAPHSRVLDLGSGLGGPARTLAEATGCHVTGIDLTPEFCEAATALSEWTGLAERTEFRAGDATRTGAADSAYDAALTVHVAMNIPDKPALYAEAYRTLRPDGRFVAYDVLQGAGGEVRYPVPWAEDPSTSFLATPAEMRRLLLDAGFEIVDEVDSSAESLAWFTQVRRRIEQSGAPPVTFAVFLADSFTEMAANQVANLAEDRIRTIMFVCRKPGDRVALVGQPASE